jgi:hypothetical protein
MDLCLFLNHKESEVEGIFEVAEYIWKCVIMELDISEQDPEDMDLIDVVLE